MNNSGLVIPIKFKGDEKETVHELYHKLLDVSNQKDKKDYISHIKSINSWCLSNININGRSFTFPEIIQASYDTLWEIVKKYGNRFPAMPDKDKKFMTEYLYNHRFSQIREDFSDKLEIKVCPYCNRNFVNSASNRTMCDPDHFFDKKEYPVMAVSFYNLVPVCHSCNHVKGVQKISYSPHNKKYSTDDLLTFEFYISGIDFLSDENQIGIEIMDDTVIRDNIDKLRLREVYQVHADLVQECIKKAIVFHLDYLSYLYRTYVELFESEEELYRIVYGNYLEEMSYGKRPLAKLTSDIMKGLLNSCYGLDW